MFWLQVISRATTSYIYNKLNAKPSIETSLVRFLWSLCRKSYIHSHFVCTNIRIKWNLYVILALLLAYKFKTVDSYATSCEGQICLRKKCVSLCVLLLANGVSAALVSCNISTLHVPYACPIECTLSALVESTHRFYMPHSLHYCYGFTNILRGKWRTLKQPVKCAE